MREINKMFKIGIVGVGSIGSAHFNTVVSGKVKGMELGAACDIDPRRLDECRAAAGDIPVFSDYREMIDSGLAEAVLISTPHPLHAEISCYAIEKGLHVLSEKPEDIRVSAARELNEKAKRSGKVFGIMFNQRTDPIYIKAREIVRSGELGEIKRSVWIITNWYRTQAYYDSGSWRATWKGEGGGVLMNQAPHNLDLWQWICGMPREIYADCKTGRWHNIEVEDEAALYATYENGATGVFITSTGDLPGTNRLEISGTKGQIVIEQGKLIFRKLLKDEREICRTEKKSWIQPELTTEIYEPADRGPAHLGILQNFANAVNHGEKLIAPGIEGINELSISNAAYLSSWTKKPVSLPLTSWDEAEFEKILSDKQAGSRLKDVTASPRTYTDYAKRWKGN